MIIISQAIFAWLLADVITGIVHWFEDRYLQTSAGCGIVSSIADDNHLHHSKPTAMLLHSHWENMRMSAMFAWPASLLLLMAGAPLWLWLSIAFASLGNVVHRWAHTPVSQLPQWVRVFQESGLFISHDHHDSHHRYMGRLIDKRHASRAYCPMTSIMNPFLDWMDFWGTAESLLRNLGLRTVDHDPFKD